MEIPLTVRHGDTRDISPFLTFQFMEPVYYLDYTSFPQTQEKPGHWVGVAPNVGDMLCYEILTERNTIINRSAVRTALTDEHQNRRLGERFPTEPQEIRFQVFPPTPDNLGNEPDMMIGNPNPRNREPTQPSGGGNHKFHAIAIVPHDGPAIVLHDGPQDPRILLDARNAIEKDQVD